jgi:hypothetical protein
MLQRVCLSLLLLAAMRAWPQQAPGSTQDAGASSDDSSQMQTPPPMSGEAYPVEVGSETRSNFLAGGLTFVTAYNDNVLGGGASGPVSDVSYSIRPTITLRQSTSRQQRSFTYSPGFTFYEPTSALNEADQSANAAYHYQLSPHLTVGAAEGFSKSSSVFSQYNTSLSGPVSGAPQPAAVIAPFAGQTSNSTNGDLTYQLSANAMIGGTGMYTRSSINNSSQATGLFDSSSDGGSFSYSLRLSTAQYFGVKYQFLRSLTDSNVLQTETQGHTIAPFYTVYFKRAFSISLSGGPQYTIASQSKPLEQVRSWAPVGTASMGWQGLRTSLAASYSRAFSDVGGLLGAFNTSSVNATGRWQMSHSWNGGLSALYGMQKNADTAIQSSVPGGGHSVSGGISATRLIGDRLRIDFTYIRLHQSYSGIAVVSNAPDVDRAQVSISYQFTRPLGR